MKGLLIVPSRTDGVSFAEDISALTSLGEFTVLTNGITRRKIHELCRRDKFDVIHFVTDTDPSMDEAGRFKRVIIVHGDHITVQDLIQMSVAAGGAGLILN